MRRRDEASSWDAGGAGRRDLAPLVVTFSCYLGIWDLGISPLGFEEGMIIWGLTIWEEALGLGLGVIISPPLFITFVCMRAYCLRCGQATCIGV